MWFVYSHVIFVGGSIIQLEIQSFEFVNQQRLKRETHMELMLKIFAQV